MHQKTQIELTRRILDFVSRRTTELGDAPYPNPVSDYISPEQAARERQMLFREQPILFALSCQMPRAGDYIAADIADVPVVAVRTDAGEIRAYLNVCRHRGTKVVSGCGAGARSFTCPYHGWTYDLLGQVRRLHPEEGFPGLERKDHNLVAVPAAEKDGLIWIKASPGGSIDPDAHLGGLADEIASYGLKQYSHFETRSLRRRMNWKLIVDTFLETWHIPTLHRDTVAPIFQPAVNTFDAFGRNGRVIAPRRAILDCYEQSEDQWDLLKNSAIVYQLFPNTLLVWQADHVEIWKAWPVGNGVDECIAEASLFAPEPPVTESAQRYWGRNMDLLMRTVDEEDFPTCEGIHQGLYAGAQDHITFGRNEPGLTHYHRSIREGVGYPPVTSLPLPEEAAASK